MKISIFVNGEEYVAAKKGEKVSKQLKDIAEGECFKLADDEEFIVLEQNVGQTIVLRKEPICNMCFGKNNNFKESDVLDKLKDYQKKIQRIVGERSLKEFCLDLTSLDGLCDYGKIDVKMGLLTLEMARKYVHITDKHKTKEYCWLATPWHNYRDSAAFSEITGLLKCNVLGGDPAQVSDCLSCHNSY